jgi:hypothetical protein
MRCKRGIAACMRWANKSKLAGDVEKRGALCSFGIWTKTFGLDLLSINTKGIEATACGLRVRLRLRTSGESESESEAGWQSSRPAATAEANWRGQAGDGRREEKEDGAGLRWCTAVGCEGTDWSSSQSPVESCCSVDEWFPSYNLIARVDIVGANWSDAPGRFI